MRKVIYIKDGKQVSFEEADYTTKTVLVEVPEKTYWQDKEGNTYKTFKERARALEEGKELKFIISGLEAAL